MTSDELERSHRYIAGISGLGQDDLVDGPMVFTETEVEARTWMATELPAFAARHPDVAPQGEVASIVVSIEGDDEVDDGYRYLDWEYADALRLYAHLGLLDGELVWEGP